MGKYRCAFQLDEKQGEKLRSLARAEGLSDAAYVRQIVFSAWERDRHLAEAKRMREEMLQRIQEGKP